MLGPGRYLLGAVELVLLVGFAWVGAARVRRRWLPEVGGEVGFLAGAVLTVALLIWVAELLGSVSLFKPVPYLLCVAVLGLVLWRFVPPAGGAPMGDIGATGPAAGARPSLVATVASLVIAGIAIGHFVSGVKLRLGTGMTGFDSTWYHGPFAAGFFQSGDTWRLHFIAPQFLAWFYPANGEIFHAAGMLAFGRDLLSPFLNLGWFVGALFACWCIGRSYRVAPWSLALGAIALSVPALADQAGEARNDIAGILFLLAAVALALNAWRGEEESAFGRLGAGITGAGLALIGLAAGLAAGTKLNFLLPAAVLVLGLVAVAPGGARARALLAAGLGALAGGGYWYLRNLAHTGNPLPWVHHLGPISLPAPEQALGGREAHSVLGYLGDGSVWSDWFLPGLHHGLWIVWPLLGLGAAAGLVLAALSFRRSPSVAPGGQSSAADRGGEGHRKPGLAADNDDATGARPDGALAARARPDAALAVAGLVGLAAALSWLVAPTSASGPDGIPRGFESGLRYLAPALVLGIALLPATRPLRARLCCWAARLGARLTFPSDSERKVKRALGPRGFRALVSATAIVLVVAAVGIGYPLQRHYLRDRYADPSFSTPGLDAAFAWARDVSGARIATTSTRQYPLFGTDLSNRVQYVGRERPHGGFEAPTSCLKWRRLLNAGHYDYVVASRDRVEGGKPPYPDTARWTEGPGATEVLRKPPTVVFRLSGRLDPSTCG
jgi:hypothetical protein